MKLVLLIVAGAFATQDVTPPVISLSFSDEHRYGYDSSPTWNGICHALTKCHALTLGTHDATCQAVTSEAGCNALPTKCVWHSGTHDSTCQAKTNAADCNALSTKCVWHSGQAADGHFQKALALGGKSSSASVMCYVKSTTDSCPDPTCTASDHHDTDVKCDDPTVVMIQRNLPTTTKYDESSAMLATHDDNTIYPNWAGGENNADFATEKNEAKLDSCVQDGGATGKWEMTRSHKYAKGAGYEGAVTCVNRHLLGQYLVTYGARDRSGNEADKVSFSFLFVDPFVPHLSWISAHKQTGYSNVMKFWPKKLATAVGTGTGDAVYDSTDLDVEGTNFNTWGAFYSAWSTVKQGANNSPFELETNLFSTTTTGLSGTDYDSTEDRFDFESAQAPAGWDRFDNLEAGNCQGVFGGFISAVDDGEEKIIGGAQAFCAANLNSASAAYGSKFLEKACTDIDNKNACDAESAPDSGVYPCKWIAGCDRTTKDTWAYPVSAVVLDNYREKDKMKVHYKVKTATWSSWQEASQKTATTESLCMRPGAPYVIDWIVSDEAGIFGFEHKDNMQTHRIQITVTDNTRPVVYPVTYGTTTKSQGADTSQQDIAPFSGKAEDSNDFTWMSCKEMTQESLCKGQCTWTTGVCARNDGGDENADAYSCRDPVGATGCSGMSTIGTCWAEASGIGSCVWTRTAMMTRSTACDSESACTDQQLGYQVNTGTAEEPVYVKKCKSYEWTDRSAFTSSNTVHASTVMGTALHKCRSQKAASKATSNDPSDTNIFLECGTLNPAAPNDPSKDATKIAPDQLRGDVSDTYQEHGFLAEDNWDNFNNVGSCKGSHQEIHCIPDTTTPHNQVQTKTGTSTKGKCHIDNTQLAHTTNTGSVYLQAIEGADNGGATFLTDYLVAYKYTDANSNTAWPVTRRVVVDDTTPPEIIVRGDCTIENSAGAHTNDGAGDLKSYSCIASHDGSAAWNHNNRFNKTCSELAGDCLSSADTCTACTGNCYWHRNSADTLVNGQIVTDPTVGQGLFDHDRIAKFFDHRDNCDRNVITIVTLHEGECIDNSQGHACAGAAPADSKIKCGTGIDKAECALDIFKWNGEEVHDQSHDTESIFAADVYKQSFPEYEAGKYAVQYHTIDASGHTATACRNIQNVDHTHPIIQILGSDQMTLEATHQGNYIDDGATCSDQVDGVISQNVEVSGDVVNLSKVGTYTITYNCKDSANNEAPAAQRTVVVAQTSCPKCTMYGKHSTNSFDLKHEASFPYTDAGATCSDVIDGTVTTLCSTSNTGYSGSDNSEALCGQGSNLVDVDTTGAYIIEYRAINTVGLANDDDNCRGGPNEYKRTVEVVDTLKPVITLRYSNTIVANGQPGVSSEATKTTVDYPSAVGSPNSWTTQGSFPDPGDAHKNGGLGLMAEQTTSAVNGWVIGAFASAVAGLALLGYSTRRTTVATSVPV